MGRRLIKFMLSYSLVVAACVLAAPAQERELASLSSSIRDRLTDLRAQSASMTLLCETLRDDLKISQEELQTWKEQSTRLSDSLTSINEQLNASYKTITRYEQKLRARTKVLVLLTLIVAVRLLLMLAGYALYFKGIRLPRWLDILL